MVKYKSDQFRSHVTHYLAIADHSSNDNESQRRIFSLVQKKDLAENAKLQWRR